MKFPLSEFVVPLLLEPELPLEEPLEPDEPDELDDDPLLLPELELEDEPGWPPEALLLVAVAGEPPRP